MPFSISQYVADLRREIVQARIELVGVGIPFPRRHELWTIVDTREWLIKLASNEFHAELEKIDREIEAALRSKRDAI